MRDKKAHFCLKRQELAQLQSLVRGGISSARRLNRAHILILLHKGKKKIEIAEFLSIERGMVSRTLKKYKEGGLESALNEKNGKRGKPPKLDPRQRTELIAIACSDPPDGRKTWTTELLAQEMVKRGIVGSIGREAVRLVLKKMI